MITGRWKRKEKPVIPQETLDRLNNELAQVTQSIEVLTKLGSDQHLLDGLLTSKKAIEFELAGTVNKYSNTKVSYKGEWYDSKREADFAKALDAAGVPYQRQVWITIHDSFMLTYERIDRMRMKVDFLLYDKIIVDVKGDITPESKVKWKILKFIWRDRYFYFFAFKKAEFDGLITFIKNWKKDNGV